MSSDHTSQAQGSGGRLLGWLRFGRTGAIEGANTASPPANNAHQSRRALVGNIGDFLVEYDLDVTPHNLAIAHSVVSGLNPRLRRKIASQRAAGGQITQSWLDQATAAEGNEDDKATEQLIARLEKTIADFRTTTSGAHTSTREYGDALELHVGQLESIPEAGAIISELAGYARSMLQRSRAAENELRKREEEAATLRHNLDRARRDAEIDFLTGLPNRRSFEVELERTVAEAAAAGEPLCVAFCDIDHFKQVNDTHGHDAGDRVICVVARTLADISDDKCHIARHGGEEFVILFRDKDVQAAVEALDSARAALASRRMINRRTRMPFGQITFSGGVADVFAYASPSEALAAADEALYRAKQGGRNRIDAAGNSSKAAA